ncbi:MAG: hypothetical protein IKK06_05940, partial [Clostridia bacterium]|nr:hypothetical protein [Clostridia bacterium]
DAIIIASLSLRSARLRSDLHVPSAGREPPKGVRTTCEFFSLVSHGEKNYNRCLFARNEFGQATQLLKSLRDEKSYYNFSENGSFRQGKFFGVFKNLFFKKGS